jgi:hypothetical protein
LEGPVAGRQRDPAAFRPDPTAGRGLAPSRRQAVALVAGLVLVAGTVAVASYTVKANKAQAFDLFYGSVYLNDERAPVAVDLADGKPTVRLVDANTQVSAKQPTDLDVVPLTNSTLLLNRASGEFNLIDSAGFVVKTKNGGVPLPRRAGPTTATGVAAGSSAYIVQTDQTGTSVYLVGQSTVQSATGVGAKVKPRAYSIVDQPATTAPGDAVSANGDLWLRVGGGTKRTIKQLSLPRGSNAGVTLHSADRASVAAVSAIGATTGRDGGDVVAVGAPTQVQVFAGSASPRRFAVKGLFGVDTILAASNQAEGTLSFLYHSSTGWSLVSVPAGGGAGVGPIPLVGIDGSVRLAPPAASRGGLYTMDTGGTGRVWRIGPRGAVQAPTDAATYPVVRDAAGKPAEVADFSDAYIIGRGARVVFDSPSHVQALGLFTDASHAPVDIDKSAAVSLNTTGTASALSQGHNPKKSTKQTPSRDAAPAAPQPISDKVRCRTVVQVPHIPTITQATPGSRSVQLQWSYPLLDPRDCAPSTYTVAVQLLSTAAPPPPAAVTVQGQDGVNLTGLFPDTRYRITVTAYLNGRGTPSAPVEIATGPEGPAAPTNVHASTDGSGNWTITWTSCGGVAQGCVPAATWSVIPSFCDGAGLASAPATISIAGDPTQHSFRATFPGNDALLGRGLKFQVEGIGTRGTVGTPGPSDGCAFSWRPPVADGMTLTASQPAATTLGGSTTTTVNLDLGDNPVRAAGGVGAQITFRLSGPGGTKTVGPVTFRGASQRLSGTFSGVQAGANYTARASVSAPKHPESSVAVGPVTVTTRADWPSMTVDASCPSDPGPIVLSCTLTVKVNGLSSAAANGELFSFDDNSRLECASTFQKLTKDSFDPARESLVLDGVALLQLNGPCSVSVALVEVAPSGSKAPLVFGGKTSPVLTQAVTLANPPTLDARQGDFTAGFDNAGGRSNVQVRYQGGTSDSDVSQITTSWTEEVRAPNGTSCGSATSQPTRGGIEVPVDPTCVNRFGGQTSGWSVIVGYQDQAGGAQHSFTYQLSGGPPTYQPCTVTASDFTATWSGTAAAPAVGVTYGGGAAKLAGCSNWVYVLKDTTGQECGRQDPGTPSPQSTGIADGCTSARTNAWTVTIGYTDTAGDGQTAGPIPVGGPPP